MASIHPDNKSRRNYWRISWREGTRQRTKVVQGTKAEVKAAILPRYQATEDRLKGRLVSVETPDGSFPDIVGEFERWATARYASHRHIIRIVRRFVKEQQVREISDVTARALKEFYEAQLRSTKTVTANLYIAYAKTFTAFLHDRLFTRENIGDQVQRIASAQAPTYFLDDLQLIQTKKAAERGFRRDMVTFLSETGLRIGEFIALEPRHYLRDRSPRPAIYVAESQSDEEERPGPTKSRKTRVVPLSRKATRVVKRAIKGRHPRLFVSQDGNSSTRRNLYFVLKRTGKRAGLPFNLGPHVLRHTFAVKFLTRGGDIRTLQGLLGHANISTTERYLHFVEGVADRDVDLPRRRHTP